MKIVHVQPYIGPNIYTPFPVIRLSLDMQGLEDWTSDRLGPRFGETLFALLPGLKQHNGGTESVTLEHDLATPPGLPLGFVVARVAVELQRRLGARVTLGGTARSGGGRQQMLVGYEQLPIGLMAARLAVDLVLDALPADADVPVRGDAGFDPRAALQTFAGRAGQRGLDATTLTLVRAAQARGVPWSRLHSGDSLVQLGHGAHRRILAGTMTDGTAATALRLTGRPGTAVFLGGLGVTMPVQIMAQSADEAVAFADERGYPVTVKPMAPDNNQGTSLRVGDAAGVRAAFDKARRFGDVMVETFFTGNTYRLLVAGDQLVAAERADPNGNTGTGDVDVTGDVHPDNRNQAVRLNRLLGIDIAAYTVITAEIGVSHLESEAVYCGIRCAPDIGRFRAAHNSGRDIPGSVIAALLPGPAHGRIPIAAVTGTNGKSTTCHMLAAILKQAGLRVGLVSTLGAAIDGEVLSQADVAGAGAATVVLNDPAVDAAVLETARGGIVQGGLAFQTCDTAALLNVSQDHLGEYGIDTLEDMARVKSVVLRAARKGAVVNADDPLCLQAAAGVEAEHLYLVSTLPGSDAVTAHITGGGRAAVLENTGADGPPELVIHDGTEKQVVLSAAAIPATYGGRVPHNIQNALFAAALAHAMDMPMAAIRGGLAGFETSFEAMPSRANVFLGHPFPVIVEYAHNPAGFESVGRAVANFTDGGRRICVFTSPADRNDDHLNAIAATVAAHFDVIICRDSLLEDRAPGEVLAKLEQALKDNGVTADALSVIPDRRAAARAALTLARKGDAVFIMSSVKPDPELWHDITTFTPQEG